MVASIEAPFALLEEPVKAFFFDAIESTQMTLGLIPEVFNAINVVALVGEELGVVDPHVAEVANVESIVGLERIGIDDTVGLDLLLDYGQQCRSARVGNDRCIDLPAPFEQAKDRYLACRASTSPALAPSSEVAFVGLHFPAELVARKLAGDEFAKPHEETRSGIAMDSGHFRCGPGGGANDEQLDQLRLFAGTQSTLPFIHDFYTKLVA